MRDIKFRAWAKYGEMFPNVQNHINGDWAFGNMLNNSDEFEIMQYTGLKDKNGVEIYEGDILAYGEIVPERPVIFENGAFRLQDDDDNHSNQILVVDTAMRLEVIGNIYENAELLEVEK